MSDPSSISLAQRLALDLQASRQSLEAERHNNRLLLQELDRLNAEVDRLRGSVHKESNSRLQAEDALNEMRDRLKLAVDAANLALWDWRVGAQDIFHTARWGEMVGDVAMDGYWPIDALNKIAHPDDVKRVYGSLGALVDGRCERAECQYRVRTPDGWLWIESHGMVAERDAQGKPTRLMGSHADISQRKQAEAHWQQARELAEQASRLKSEFLANISHEVRTPLNAIMGLNQLLLESRLDEEQRRWLQMVDRSAHTLLSLLNDVLDFSRIESGKLAIERLPVVLGRELGETVALYQQQAAAKGLTLSLDVAADLSDPIATDPLRLRQILGNLLSNAVKFTARGGRIAVQAAASRDASPSRPQLRLTVTDTGVGIPAEAQAHIFDAFTQADASTARQFGGSGLGLAICARLARLLGGDIALESQVGQGSTFTVRLPLDAWGEASAASDEPAAAVAATVVPATDLAGLSVLLAEDNEVNELLMSRLLTQFGCQIDIARDGQEAYDRWSSGRYALIVMDVQMPRVTGLEASRRIRAAEALQGRPRTPILAVTANALDGDQQVCLSAGMDGYVSKPVNSQALQLAIRKVLRPLQAPPGGSQAPGTAPASAGTVSSVESAPPEDLLTLFEGDLGQLRRFHQRLEQGLDESLGRLQAAGEQRVFAEVNAVVHALSGMLGFVKAQRALRLCQGLRLAAGNQDWSLYRRALPLLRAECKRVLDDLRAAASAGA